jgi:hypothetical protein
VIASGVLLALAVASMPATARAQSQCGERIPGVTASEQRAMLRAVGHGVRGRSLRIRGAGWHVVEGRCLAIAVVWGAAGPLHVALLERNGRRWTRHVVGPDLWPQSRLPCGVSEVAIIDDLDDDSIPDVRVVGRGDACVSWDPGSSRAGEQLHIGEAIASGGSGVLLWSGLTLEIGEVRWLTTEDGQATWGGVHAIRRAVRRGANGLEVIATPVLCAGSFDEPGLAATCTDDGPASVVPVARAPSGP